MIRSREDLALYLASDRISMEYTDNRIPFPVPLEWKLIKRLRKTEYHANNGRSPISRVLAIYHKYMLILISRKIAVGIPLNTVGPGLSIVHGSGIFINASARIGNNCRLHNGINIAAGAKIGNDVYIGPGAKILENAVVGNDIAIGANAVVHGEFIKEGVTIAGVPARVIKETNSRSDRVKGFDPAKARAKQ